MEQKDTKAFFRIGYRRRSRSFTSRESPESRMMMLGGSDPGSGLPVSIKDGSEVTLHLEEGGTMNTVGASTERRPSMSVRSFNLEIQTSTRLRTMSTSLGPPTKV